MEVSDLSVEVGHSSVEIFNLVLEIGFLRVAQTELTFQTLNSLIVLADHTLQICHVGRNVLKISLGLIELFLQVVSLAGKSGALSVILLQLRNGLAEVSNLSLQVL